MGDSDFNLFKEWRTADQQAHAIEQALSKASLAALDGHDDAPPTEVDREKARKLRHAADDLFHLAMAEMARRAADNRR